MKLIRKWVIALGTALSSAGFLLAQQPVAPAFQQAAADVTTIAIAAGTLAAGLIGLVALVRVGWKLSQGDTDSVTALVFAVFAIVIGFLANTFIT